jgi:YD repeat-containing protein
MQREHYLSLPLETQILTDNKVVKGKVTEYDLVTGTEGNFYKPAKEFSLFTDGPIDNCQQIHLDNSNNLVYDSKYSLVNNYEKYDTTGNIQEFYKENDVHTSYFWGYNNIYPIVKAENVSYEDLNTAVDASATNGLETLLDQIEDMLTTDQKNQWHAFNDALRNHSLLSNAHVTTYTHKPLVGVTSSTDPAGITTYYEYDVFGRLSAIKDINGNILKKYTYHYANE